MAKKRREPPTEADLKEAKQVLLSEAQCIEQASRRLDERFLRAVEEIEATVRQGGKVIVLGIGKSGKIAAKIAATLVSTGTPSMFLHAGEASHGDLGVIGPRDLVLAFSYSGTSEEIVGLIPSLRALGVKLVSVVGQLSSALAKASDIVIDASIAREACPLNLAPTSSTAVALALGDALAIVLSKRMNFKEEDFAAVHPGGALGRRLKLTVQDLMKTGPDLAWVHLDAEMAAVVSAITEKALGAVLVRDEYGKWKGLITDGDIRRALKHRAGFFDLRARDIMTKNPITVAESERAITALELMENRASQINVLPVVSEKRELVGLVRLHDLIGKI